MDGRSTSVMSDVDDMVTVSLNEVLAARNRFLEEREFWALCRECCLTLEYVHDCHDLFQSLCISPDTVAFDPEGNVCFLDLDMEPEPLYIAPELGDSGNSFKSHLFSLGMTLLFATEYNSESDDPKAQLSDKLTNLLADLTGDVCDLRPDLDTVIDICDKSLDGELSQILCLNIVGLRAAESPALQEDKPNTSLQLVTDELTAYLESQSGFVQSPTANNDDLLDQYEGVERYNGISNAKQATCSRDKNDNCVAKSKLSSVPPSLRDIIMEASPDEEDMIAYQYQDDTNPLFHRRARKKQGIMLGDLLRSVNRYFGENELWALCRECVLCLQRKKKHLPAYISPETVMVCDSGSIAFKAIPDEKPLEVVYMARELQQKGTLNEKTCLYGLGITLRKAAGVKLNSPNLNITDGEALEILINSFLQTNPDRRPSLDTAYEMCEEYEKVNESTSRETCVQIYKEALECVTSSKESTASFNNQKHSKDSSNSWDSSSQEQTHGSSGNTQSIAQGDTTEAEESIDEIPHDFLEDETVVSATSAFKPLFNSGDKRITPPSSAFKPMPMNNVSAVKGDRVPSAFSSPATHFKPIILHESTAQTNSTVQSSGNQNPKSDVDVVSKLRELKQNLMKKRGTSDLSPRTGSQMTPPGGVLQNTVVDSKSGAPSSSDLGNYMKLLQNQGQIPDTDTLASAIAKYLHQELTDSQDKRNNQNNQISKSERKNSNVIYQQAGLNSNTHSQHHSTFVSHNEKNRLPVPSFESSVSSHVQSTTPQMTYPPPQFLMSKAQPALQGHPELHRGAISHPQQYQIPSSQAGTSPSMQYNVPMSGVPAHNIPSVQFTLVQDPVTGLMQMIPVSYLPVPPQHLGPVPGNHLVTSNTFTSSASSNLGAQLYDKRSVIPSAQQAFPSHFDQMKSQAVHQSTAHLSIDATKTQSQGDYNRDPNQRYNSQREDDNDSRSSSPSPSKDSGICITQQSYNKDSLMDKLLSSGNSNRQKILSRVLGIIREEFAEDGIFDSGVEDLAIAEYVISLTALKWDTFSCAVREKYSHLIWTEEVLMILHDVVTDSRPKRSWSSQPTPDEQPRSHGHSHTDKVISGIAGSSRVQDNQRQLPNQRNPQIRQPDISQHKGPARYGIQRTDLPNAPSTNQHFNRPRSEIARTMTSSASDSTDSESTDIHHRYKKRYNLDKTKSSSLHNVAHQGNSQSDSLKSFNNNTYSPPLQFNNKLIDNSINKQTNPSVFSKDYFTATKNKTELSEQKERIFYLSTSNDIQINQNNNSGPSASHKEGYDDNVDASSSYPHDTKKPSIIQSSQHVYKQNQTSAIHGQPQFSLLPSKLPPNTSTPHLLKSSDHSNSTASISPRPESSQSSSVSSQQPKFNVPPYNRPIRQPSSSNTFQWHENQLQLSNSSKTNGPLTGDHSIHSHQIPVSLYDNTQQRLEKNKAIASSSSMSRNSKCIYDDEDHENDSDVDFNSSSEMRRLAAEKPELYDRRTPSLATPVDRSFGGKPTTSQVPPYHLLNTSRDSIMTGSLFKDLHKPDDKNQNANDSIPFSGNSDTLPDRRMKKRSNNAYARSMSAVYSVETGVKVSDGDNMKESLHQRRGSDGSIDLPPVNNVLLPYVKKGQVVYHSAMIQLSLTPEVDHFIHSIDEENKVEIETQLASLSQEINMQWRQRRKTQRFFKKLSEQNLNSKVSKGDQNVSDQMLKDMAEMTKKLAFLNLCHTHLQMLLAELNGLDVCYLHSLTVCDGQSGLILEPLMENKYLQFRTFNTREAGSMSILQAGTPKGLLSYLYTSSALSDGYIHQFLLCFRYILTAEQMFNFIVDKCKCAQRSKFKDKNILRIQYRSLDLLQFWIEGYFSIDFGPNPQLTKKLGEFIQEQVSANAPEAQELYSLYAACRLHENTELMLMTEMEEDEENDNTYFMHIANPKQWESFRSLLKRSKSDKSLNSSGGISRQKSSDNKATSASAGPKSTTQFSLADVEVHALAEQLTLMEQAIFRRVHPVHFLNSQFHGVGVALSMSGLRTPSMSRKLEPSDSKRGLFVGDPLIESNVVRMISHSQELAHWVSAEILSCGSGKFQTGVIQKFISVAHMCQEVRNFATSLSIFEGLDNLVVKQLPVWKNISSKYMTYMEELTEAKMKLKSEATWLTNSKGFHIYPTIPCALFAALHLQQMEIGGFTLANGLFKWDKMRSICETVDQLRIFRDHEYGFHSDLSLQRILQRRLNEFSDQDLHAVASTHENNFRRHSSSSSLSGTLKKIKDIIQIKKK